MLGNMIGGFVLALTGEPQSTWAWERGSIGEQKLAAALSAIADVIVLNDRRVRGTKGNIDHIVVAPAGVFVVDAKNYDGLIQTGYRGGLFSRDERLYVGGRDCSQLAANMAWQAKAVRDVLSSVHRTETIAVRAVLCFVDCEWPLVGSPESYKGVYLESPQSITNLIAGPGPVGTDLMARINRTLSIAFPSK